MKRLLTFFILLLFALVSFSQTFNGYKYAYVNTIKYQNGQADIYGVTSEVITRLKNKGFYLLRNSWPKEAKNDECLVLFCNITHSNVKYVLGQPSTIAEVKLTFSNCKNEIVYEIENKAVNGWYTFSTNLIRAVEKSFKTIDLISYNFNSSKTPEKDYPKIEITDETEESMKLYLSSNKTSPIEGIYKSYQSDNLFYYKIGIIKKDDKYKAIIIESALKQWKAGEVKAYFEPSSMKGFYSAKWYMGDKTSYETFALMENEAILSIEFKNPKTGEKRTDKFIKMYPSVDRNISFKDKSKSSGSGFFLTNDGIIATNAHVVENTKSIKIQITNEIGNFEYSVKVLLVDNQNDVALIKINDEKFKGLSSIPYSLVEKAEIGEKVFTIGYPLNDVMGTNYKVTNGIISAISGIADDIRYYQVSVPLQPGNSGGPLFNNDGNIIGITSARLSSKAVGTDVENVNYAIKISYLLNLYNMLPNADKLNTLSTQTNKELQDQVKILKNYVCLIRSY